MLIRLALFFITAVGMGWSAAGHAGDIDDLLQKAEEALGPTKSAPPPPKRAQAKAASPAAAKPAPSQPQSAAAPAAQEKRPAEETQKRLAALLATDQQAGRMEREAPRPTMVITPALGVVQPFGYTLTKDDDDFTATDRRSQPAVFAQLTLYSFETTSRLKVDLDGAVAGWSGERQVTRTGVEIRQASYRHDGFLAGLHGVARYAVTPQWQAGLQLGGAAQMIRQVGETDSEHIFAMEPTWRLGLRGYRSLSQDWLLTFGVGRVEVATLWDLGLRIHL